MPMNKPHLEFTHVDMSTGWATPPGYPAGIKQKILASDLDESRKMGSRTRLLRFDPGVYTTAPFVHDHWEEVYLVSGDLIVGNDAQGKGGEPFAAPTYACRPPGEAAPDGAGGLHLLRPCRAPHPQPLPATRFARGGRGDDKDSPHAQ